MAVAEVAVAAGLCRDCARWVQPIMKAPGMRALCLGAACSGLCVLLDSAQSMLSIAHDGLEGHRMRG